MVSSTHSTKFEKKEEANLLCSKTDEIGETFITFLLSDSCFKKSLSRMLSEILTDSSLKIKSNLSSLEQAQFNKKFL